MITDRLTTESQLVDLAEAIQDVERKGWFLWHLGRRTDGSWWAQLYNRRHTKMGQGGDLFSAHGFDPDPAGAVYAAAEGPAQEGLFGGKSVDRNGISLDARAEAIEARIELTKVLRSWRK